MGLLSSRYAHADDAQIGRREWIIIATITDLDTGKVIKELELSPDLKFTDQTDCESILDRVGPIPPPERRSLETRVRNAGGQAAALSCCSRDSAAAKVYFSSTASN
jgi:hypothetical protein